MYASSYGSERLRQRESVAGWVMVQPGGGGVRCDCGGGGVINSAIPE